MVLQAFLSWAMELSSFWSFLSFYEVGMLSLLAFLSYQSYKLLSLHTEACIIAV